MAALTSPDITNSTDLPLKRRFSSRRYLRGTVQYKGRVGFFSDDERYVTSIGRSESGSATAVMSLVAGGAQGIAPDSLPSARPTKAILVFHNEPATAGSKKISS